MVLVCVNLVSFAQTTDRGKEVLKNAQAGDAAEQYRLGTYYEHGWEGFEKNGEKAFSWFLKSANQNELKAVKAVANAYEFGKLGVEKDSKKYVEWLRKGVELNDAASMTDLGELYKTGRHGVTKNDKEFLKWTLKAVDEHKYIHAMYQLGDYYREIGNKDEAVKWYKKCIDSSYEQNGSTHRQAERDLEHLGVQYGPNKNGGNEVADEKDGKVVLYDRLGNENMTCKLVKEGKQYKVKVDNGLYPIKPYNRKINGVLYVYYLQLFDREYYIKEDADLKSGSAASSSSSTSSTSKQKSSSSSSSSSSSGSSSIEKKVSKKVTKSVDKLKKKILR